MKKICQLLDDPQTLPNVLKVLPKWQKIAQSGHTGSLPIFSVTFFLFLSPSVTRFGNFLDFGQLFKAFGNN